MKLLLCAQYCAGYKNKDTKVSKTDMAPAPKLLPGKSLWTEPCTGTMEAVQERNSAQLRSEKASQTIPWKWWQLAVDGSILPGEEQGEGCSLQRVTERPTESNRKKHVEMGKPGRFTKPGNPGTMDLRKGKLTRKKLEVGWVRSWRADMCRLSPLWWQEVCTEGLETDLHCRKASVRIMRWQGSRPADQLETSDGDPRERWWWSELKSNGGVEKSEQVLKILSR